MFNMVSAWARMGLLRLAGLMLCAVVGMAAKWLSGLAGVPVMLMALLCGLGLNFLYRPTLTQAGVDFASRQLLRWGIALLGLRITLDQVLALGWEPLFMALFLVPLTLGIGLYLSRVLGLGMPLGLVSAGAVGICGASAAMAVSSCLPQSPQREQELGWTILGVSVLSTLAMLTYPLIARTMGWDATLAGLFVGATIHDVAQVVGAGYSLSTAAGDVAVVMKILRVAMLVPVLLTVSWLVARRWSTQAPVPSETPILPGFAIAFVSLVLLQTAVEIPHFWLGIGQQASQWALILAMAAIGLKSQPASWRAMGWGPAVLMLSETLVLALLVWVWLAVVRGWVLT